MMQDIVAQGQAIKAWWVTFACAVPFVLMLVLWAGLRLLDWSAGIRFAQLVKLVQFNDALYFGLRWLGGCIVISAAMIMLGMVLAS